MRKKIFIAFLFATSGLLAQPTQLKNFEETLTAFTSGNEVRVVIRYAKCKLMIDGEEVSAPDAIGGFEMSTFEYFAPKSIGNEKGFVSASENVLISHGRYGYVYNYAKLRIYEDNSVEIIARYLDPLTYEVKMDETFYSAINDGANDEGVYLFID